MGGVGAGFRYSLNFFGGREMPLIHKNPFDRTVRIEDVYLSLERDCKNDSNGIIESLPRFVRFAMIEKDKGWSELINRYDLQIDILATEAEPEFQSISADISFRTNFLIGKIGISDVALLNCTAIKIGGCLFSVKDFIQAIAYNGGFHVFPDLNKQYLTKLYEKFHVPFPIEALALARAVGLLLVGTYKSVHAALNGNPHGFCDVGSRQPQIVDSGMIITMDEKPALAYFSAQRSYTQSSVPAMERKGIRISLKLMLETQQGTGTIFSLGHRKKADLNHNLRIHYTSSMLFFDVAISASLKKTLSVPIDEAMRSSGFDLEMCIYPAGDISIGIRERLVLSEHLGISYSIHTGKLVVGADLYLQHCGDFRSTMVRVSLVDQKNRIKTLKSFGTFIPNETTGHRLPPDAKLRPSIWRPYLSEAPIEY